MPASFTNGISLSEAIAFSGSHNAGHNGNRHQKSGKARVKDQRLGMKVINEQQPAHAQRQRASGKNAQKVRV